MKVCTLFVNHGEDFDEKDFDEKDTYFSRKNNIKERFGLAQLPKNYLK